MTNNDEPLEIEMWEDALAIDADVLEYAFNIYDSFGLEPAVIVDDALLVPDIPWDDFWDMLAECTGVLIAANSDASHVITEAIIAYQRVVGTQEAVLE